MDKHDTIGHDLVGMVVDDLVVCGAEPLFMTDYIASARSSRSGSPRSSRASPRAACWPAARWSAARPRSTRAAGPGRVRRRGRRHWRGRGGRAARRRAGRAGDVVIAMARLRAALQRLLAGAPRAAEPGRLEARPRSARVRAHAGRGAAGADPDLLAGLPGAHRATEIHAFSHVTGGGLAANLARVIPEGCTPAWTAAPGRRCRSSRRWPRSAGCRPWRSRRP